MHRRGFVYLLDEIQKTEAMCSHSGKYEETQVLTPHELGLAECEVLSAPEPAARTFANSEGNDQRASVHDHIS